MVFGAGLDMPFQLGQELVVIIDEGAVEFDGLLHFGVGELFGDARPFMFLAHPLAEFGQVVLAVGVLDMG